ncbi:hypothetical protein PybrP1_001967 [[Pythium] brassicae (nom. inval.)]|nr:hypothetical protein PybrP1_001967 [[Pythium] brassicae (nom. inval.)]
MRVSTVSLAVSPPERAAAPSRVANSFVGEIGVRGELHVAVDKPEYCAGDAVTGRLTVIVSETIQCDTLSFAISGEESAQWTERGDHHSRYHEFLHHEILRAALPTPCPPGEYVFPFEYALPADVPGALDADSLYGGGAKALHATIRYTLKASIKVEGRFISDLEASHALVVREKPARPPSGALAAPRSGGVERTVSKRVRLLGCIRRGTCHVAASVKASELALGDTARVDIFVNNHTSAARIRGITCRLYQDVTMQDPAGGARVCSRPLLQVKVDGPRSGELLERPIDLVLAGKLRFPSTRGRFLACTYRISLECEMLLAKSIELHIPVTILPPRGPLRPLSARPLPTMLLAPAAVVAASAYAAAPPQGSQSPELTPTSSREGREESAAPASAQAPAPPPIPPARTFANLAATPAALPTIDLLA